MNALQKIENEKCEVRREVKNKKEKRVKEATWGV